MTAVDTAAQIPAQSLLTRTNARDAASLSAAVAALIRSGEFAPGTLLPTVRDLAATGGISANAVLAAWRSLRELGLIQTRRRSGTVVLAPTDHQHQEFRDWSAIDLAWTAPDTTLHPYLGDALMSSLTAERLNDFGRELIAERLRVAAAAGWPFEPEEWTTVGGGTEALLLAIEAVAPRGSLIALDEPLAPGVLDTVRELGLRAVGVDADDHGPRPDTLAAAVAAGAVAFVLQPGAPFAARHIVTAARTAELASVIENAERPLWVIEDDSLGPLAPRTPPSMGQLLHNRVLRIRSYCRAYGIDVRTSLLGGPKELIERVRGLRSHGVAATSRILQNTLAYLIHSPRAADEIAVARQRYAVRRSILLDRLSRSALRVSSGSNSLVVWVEVADETTALLSLMRHGVAAGPGSTSFIEHRQPALLRLSVTQLPEDPNRIEELVRYLEEAAQPREREYFG